ncbi:mitochondrial import inner membrane translocase subunit 10 [Dictyostelium discoideum AX4]|uniref:Mitochondrial import inner membrane translocase subunit Tim10 n=1 Tax=Dictyostelium discoideum TaxID=44689 RepID=TIM10_DICDI|nr:mitochondrial import inner membrane translocase subunit 10 [Dictyostelium discoideum AX4]Q54NZ0.1 RecName: Full=Mitochondrial import inner membrane translocase subunit Tim10 [Dictyostelium discoideum]EAL64919.1 mitochondrial import inner membrane translocase subunit 10 [Dictyostelium discoideum AX4]|eukprot:XP_639927.1 mitochondrial import inner membrane translocase subunit 10 [Dictyostelium discoideum AX4]
MDDVEMKVMEMKMISKMFQGILDACSAKCISKYNEGDLNVGESVCAERCVQKWMETFKKVQSKMSGTQPGQEVPQEAPAAAPEKKGWF